MIKSSLRKVKKLVLSKGVYAAGGCTWYGINIDAPFCDFAGFMDWIGGVMNFAIGFSGLVAVGLLIYGGYTYITAGGDAEKIDRGTKVITNTVIGLIVVFLAVLIIGTVIRLIEGGGNL